MSRNVRLFKERDLRKGCSLEEVSQDDFHYLRLLYFKDEVKEEEQERIRKMEKDIHHKWKGYQQQDSLKDREDGVLSYSELLDKLIQSRLRCEYCKKDIYILYKRKHQPNQWTLDRIDNERGHTNDNCVISCLRCNISKRRRNHEVFKFSKQVHVIKD